LTSAKTLFGSTRIYVFQWLRLQQVRRLADKQSRSKGVFPIMRQREPQWRRKGTIGYTFATDDGWVFRPAAKRPADRSFTATDSRPRAWRSFWRTGSPFKRAFDLKGIRLIGVDRPGYGLSDDSLWHNRSDWAEDVAEMADRLGIERFSILGAPGGGL